MTENAANARGTFFNPLIPDGPDPWMVWHDGYYYLTRSHGYGIAVRKARSIVDLWAAEDHIV